METSWCFPGAVVVLGGQESKDYYPGDTQISRFTHERSQLVARERLEALPLLGSTQIAEKRPMDKVYMPSKQSCSFWPTAFEFLLCFLHATLSSTLLSFHNKMPLFLFLAPCSGATLCCGPHEPCSVNRRPWNTSRWSLHCVRSLVGEVWRHKYGKQVWNFYSFWLCWEFCSTWL